MAAYNIYEAKTSFSSLVDKAEKGEEIIIARAGKPVVRMVPMSASEPPEASQPKYYRKAPGSVEGNWDDLLAELDKPWAEDIQRAFGMSD